MSRTDGSARSWCSLIGNISFSALDETDADDGADTCSGGQVGSAGIVLAGA